jgi:HEAT repeat protein
MIGPGAEAAIPALLVSLEDADKQLAGESAFALGMIGRADEAILAALMRHVSDPDFSMSMFVNTALQRLTGEGFNTPQEWQAWWEQRKP